MSLLSMMRPARMLAQRSAACVNDQCQRRTLMLQEAQGIKVLQEHGVTVPKYGVAQSPQEVAKLAEQIGGKDYVLKAQVLAGGRGKGRFDSGLQGGVQIVFSPHEAREKATKMIGYNLITKQTDGRGRHCASLMVCERLFTRREYYFSILMDRSSGGPVMIGSSRGGVNIEEVAAEEPSAIIRMPVDINIGLQHSQAVEMATKMCFSDECVAQAAESIEKLYDVFLGSDCTLLEINPMAETNEGKVYCMDCKIVLDDNAEFRQKSLFTLRDTEQDDPMELQAAAANLNYIKLSGDIGCMVNGAGLAMATMDIIKLKNGDPANFLDVGGGADKDQVKEAFKIISSDPKVRSILVNIFGGIMRCDVIAKGILAAAAELDSNCHIIVRLQGTKMEEAEAILSAYKPPSTGGVNIIGCNDLDQAAKLAVNTAKVITIMKDPEMDRLGTSFTIPI